MKIKIDFRKTIDENAALYYEKAKKAKKKLKGALNILDELKLKVSSSKKEIKTKKITKIKKKLWYEKFRYFYSSEGFLCVGGKDATTNEILVKKHLEKNDIIFHSNIPGSPFVIVKQGQKSGEETKREAGEFCVSYSRAWRNRRMVEECYWVLPEQITKTTKSGEYISKGSFMIYGKRNILECVLKIAISVVDNQLIYGPESSINKKTKNYILVIPGSKSKNEVAKTISKKLDVDLDLINQVLPPGDSDIKLIGFK